MGGDGEDSLVLKRVVRPSEKVTAKPYSVGVVSPSVDSALECHPAGNQAR